MKVFAVINQKGGVGKTTTAVTIAAGLASMGKRTLLIDLDSQGNVADWLGLDAGDDLYAWLSPDIQTPLDRAMCSSGRERLSVIRASKRTGQLKSALGQDGLAAFVLRNAIKKHQRLFDVVVMDCAPSIDLLQTAAIVAANYMLVPTKLDQLAIKGVRDALQSLIAVTGEDISTCELGGVIPTFYERTTNETQTQLTHLAESFGPVLMPPIPVDTRCREAERNGKVVFEYAPNTRAMIGVAVGDAMLGGYWSVVTRIIELL